MLQIEEGRVVLHSGDGPAPLAQMVSTLWVGAHCLVSDILFAD